MTDERLFDHRPDPELGAALRRALEPGDQAEFVARVMARYDATLAEASVPTWEVLARWARPGIAAAVVAAVFGGFQLGRTLHAPDAPATLDAAMAPTSGPGLAALVTAPEPPDASVLFASLVEPR
ncbi:MAG TPA: hypothetical protein VGQ25_02335 [Gemmatimonadales bacterium]|jgi:hypothetical protein|nr:hypothetical protein [Gemmatimonadales bacterium]